VDSGIWKLLDGGGGGEGDDAGGSGAVGTGVVGGIVVFIPRRLPPRPLPPLPRGLELCRSATMAPDLSSRVRRRNSSRVRLQVREGDDGA
jgi:hypothetical protein